MQHYTLTQALNVLEDGRFHTVGYIACDVHKGKAGRVVRINKCKLLPQKNNDRVAPTSAAKKQNHYAHATRNLLLENGEYRKMHIHLLFHLNFIPVL